MSDLHISLLGTFQVTKDGQVITGFGTDKVRALLAYLVTNVTFSHRRAKLAGLLWPDQTEQSARHNLSQSLCMLRQAIDDDGADPSFLLVSRPMFRFNPDCDYWLDVDQFQSTLDALSHPGAQPSNESSVAAIEQAMALYRGEFMADLLMVTSQAFEEWQLYQRAHLHWLAVKGLEFLADTHAARGNYPDALRYARRQIELDPLREGAHRQVMSVLALSGQRTAAIAQYEVCRQLLSEEMGIEPLASTTQLHEQIRAGTLVPRKRHWPAAQTATPPPMPADLPCSPAERFVDRNSELAALDQQLTQALLGRRRIVFVTGQAGSGKTALLAEFCRRALHRQPSLRMATGRCGTLSGSGSPYYPFRTILRTLSKSPAAEQTVVADWPTHSGQRSSSSSTQLASMTNADIILEVGQVLATLAESNPLLLVIDDLQWADPGTINLLFHLSQHLGAGRVLIIAACRSEVLTPSSTNGAASLQTLVEESRYQHPESVLDLDEADGQRFIQALLEAEPNSLGLEFCRKLYYHTGGHPLFTIELLRAMRERGALEKNEQGRWVEKAHFDWSILPARLETAILERIRRVPLAFLPALDVASVQGMAFSVEVVAHVRGADETEIIEIFSDELHKRYRLVEPTGRKRVGSSGRYHSYYRFRHGLIRCHLYRSLDKVKKPYLHEAVARCLESLYGGEASEIAAELAWHFEQAGCTARSLEYLLQAEQRALNLSAHEEADVLFRSGSELLKEIPESPERVQFEFGQQTVRELARR